MTAPGRFPRPRRVVLQYIEDCRDWRRVLQALCDLQPLVGFDLALQPVASPEHAEQLRFRGSPTVLCDGVDPFAGPRHPVGYTCRRYPTHAGWAAAPTTDQLRTALGIPR